MKKNLLVPFGLILILLSPDDRLKAQITITQAEMPNAGHTYVMAVDTSGNFSPQPASPLAQNWNYSALVNSQNNSYIFATPSSTPFFSAFPSSNLADSLVYGNSYTYYSLTPSTYSDMGFGEIIFDSAIVITLHPFFVQIPLPATYGTTDGGVSLGDTTRPFHYLLYDSARGKIIITYSDTVDAFGVMTTPYGTDTVIRQKHYDLTIDSIFVRTTATGKWTLYEAVPAKSYLYRWYAKGINYPFAIMQMNNAGTKDSIVQWYDGTTIGIDPILHSDIISVYPNPCNTQITFSCSSANAKYISVYDITGRQISTWQITNSMLKLNTSAYSAGMYFYRVSDISGNILDRGKFIVQ